MVDTKQKYLHSTERKITELGLKNSNATLLPVNTVIFSSRATIGDVTIAKVETATNQGYKNFICDSSRINYEYLYYILKHETKNIAELSSGATYLEISKAQISDFKISLPPLEIQGKIIKEINEVEYLSQAKLSAINKDIYEFNNFIESLSANTGKHLKLEELFIVNDTSINPGTIYKDNTFIYVDIDSVGKGNGRIDFSKRIFGQEAPSRAKRIAENDSILLSTVRPYLKGFAYLDNIPSNVVFSTGFAILKSKNNSVYSSKFLYCLFMNSAKLMKQMQEKMPKAAYPSINVEDINSLTVPMISIEVQNEILIKFNSIEKLVNKKEELITNMRAEIETILKKYL